MQPSMEIALFNLFLAIKKGKEEKKGDRCGGEDGNPYRLCVL